VISNCSEGPAIAYRNFNLCPHCRQNGYPALLTRLSETLPMISRSDGESFHLLLADRPLPYPIECSLGPANQVSACFWYSHISGSRKTRSTIVILPYPHVNRPSLFRLLETAADLLAEELRCRGNLDTFYEFVPSCVRAMEAVG